MHCFTGSADDARLALDVGFWISFSGIVTFPRSAALRSVAALVPIDRLLIETDAPYLAPVPHRGRRNEPAFAADTLAAVAALRGLAPPALAEQVSRNFDAFLAAAAPA
jgi:TatD DNase family protein